MKVVVKLYQNRDPAMQMVRDFEERAENKEFRKQLHDLLAK